MPQGTVGGAVASSEPDEQDHSDDPASPTTPAAAGPPTGRRQSGNSSRKRRPQEPPASELRYPRRRSLKACRLCRARKTKCDNIHPTCGFCTSIGATCSYDDGQSGYSSFDFASLEILRTLGQLVDAQKDILEAIRASNNHASNHHVNQPDAAPPPVTTPSFAVHNGRPAHSWSEEAISWTSPGHNESVIEPTRSGPGPILCQHPNDSHSVASPFEQRQEPRRSFAETSPGSFAIAGNPAALRWFGLLANDAGQEVIQTAECEAEPSRRLLDDGAFADATPLQKATRIVDGSPDTIETSSHRVSFVDDLGLPARVSERQLWQAKDSIELLPREKVLFENFVQRTSLWIDLFDPRRHFSAVVPRLALHNAGLMNAILALSCHHLSLSHDSASSETTYENDALQYHYQTLHYVQKAMRHSSYQNSDELIATTLIISTYEMVAGSSKDWERHLQGVFWILRSQDINVEIEALESAVWWAWLRQDIWAAFREKRKTYTAWTPKKTYNIMNPYEIASRAVWHLAQVVNVCSPVVSPTDRNKLRERLDTVEHLQQMLNEWRQSLPVEFYPLPAATEDDASCVFRPLLIYPPCYGLAIQAHYVSRILLSYHEPSFGGVGVYLDRMRSIESWIHIVCGVGMTLTDDASGILSSQCIFIAGMFSKDRRERECILELLAGCRRRTGWPANPFEDELEEIWMTTRPTSTSSSGL